MTKGSSEGLKLARLLMTLSGIWPLFLLWAIRGTSLVPDYLLIPVCVALILLPNGILWLRIHTAKKNHDQCPLTIGRADDHRDHILVYLFAILLPYPSNLVKDKPEGFVAASRKPIK